MLLLTDFATTKLSAPVTGADARIPVVSVAPFPDVASGGFFYAVLQDVTDKRRQEIVKVVGGDSASFVVERTSGMPFPLESLFELRLTSAALFALMGDGALYHKHAQEALETNVVFTYTDGVLTAASSIVLGLPKHVSYIYAAGRLSEVREDFAGIRRTSVMNYTGDELVSIEVSEVSL